jgi:phosphomannomutase
MAEKPIVSGSGIRGVFGESFTVFDAAAFAAAFGELVGPGGVAVGRDTRRSGPAVEAAVCAGLMSVGCSPVLLGIVPTPTVQLEAMEPNIAGGIAVTSSHNPGRWNALKLVGPDGVFLRAAARERLMKLLDRPRVFRGSAECGLPGTLEGCIERHVERVLALPWAVSRGRRLKVVLDVAGGAAARLATALMDAMEVEWTMIHPSMTPEGEFPRVAEPTVESLSDLADAVRHHGADAGFGFDPDGDRLALVADGGRLIGEEYTLALALDHILPRDPGPVVINLSTSMLSEEAAARHGCPVHRSPVGEVNVVEEMEKLGSPVGGEGNGGVIHPACHSGRDSAVAMAAVVSMLRDNPGATLSAWAAGFTDFCMIKTKAPFAGPFAKLEEAAIAGFGVPDDRRDGFWYRRDWGWFHIRKSGTEPVVRFIGESRDRAPLKACTEAFRKVVSCAE